MVVTGLPRVEPIVPTSKDEPFDDPNWLFEFKYDGFRGMVYLHEGHGRVVSRHGKVLGRFSALCAQLAETFSGHSIIFDGEIVTRDEAKRPIFLDLLWQRQEPTYIAFDLLWLDGEDLRPKPLFERRERLHQLMPQHSPVVEEVFGVEERGIRLFELMCAHDLEGVVAKRLADPYRPRVAKWLKILNPNYSQRVGRSRIFRRRR